MNSGLKIGILLAAGAAYLYDTFRQTTLAEELEKLKKQIEDGDSDVRDIVEEKTKDPEEVIKESIRITPYLDFGEFKGRKWSVRMTWKIKNVGQYTYIITGIKSVVTILGYTCKFWMPGNTSTFLTLMPGEEGEILSEKDIICLYDEGDVRDKIYDKFRGNYNYQDGLNTVTNLRIQSIFGGSRVVTYDNLLGQAKDHKGVNYWNNKHGKNMVNEDLK